METQTAPLPFIAVQSSPSFEEVQWHPLTITLSIILSILLLLGIIQEVGVKRNPMTEWFKQTTKVVGPIAHSATTQSTTQIEEERAPMPEPQIRKISAYNTAVAPSITITKAGQSLCNFVSLRDALRIAMKYKLVTYGEDSKVVVTSVAQGLALAKREKVVTIVTKGQEFLLE